ncbi:hypothetical protein LIG30_2680 [Burkholderia sp. lig30]|nr:hypothetical protein LIG30_2680 [Burkholderia sp. lig30]
MTDFLARHGAFWQGQCSPAEIGFRFFDIIAPLIDFGLKLICIVILAACGARRFGEGRRRAFELDFLIHGIQPDKH